MNSKKENTTNNKVLDYAMKRIENLLERPSCYGTERESIEFQLLMAFEFLCVAKFPDFSPQQIHQVLEAPMREVLKARFDTDKYPASSYAISMAAFVEVLSDIKDAFFLNLNEVAEALKEPEVVDISLPFFQMDD